MDVKINKSGALNPPQKIQNAITYFAACVADRYFEVGGYLSHLEKSRQKTKSRQININSLIQSDEYEQSEQSELETIVDEIEEFEESESDNNEVDFDEEEITKQPSMKVTIKKPKRKGFSKAAVAESILRSGGRDVYTKMLLGKYICNPIDMDHHNENPGDNALENCNNLSATTHAMKTRSKELFEDKIVNHPEKYLQDNLAIILESPIFVEDMKNRGGDKLYQAFQNLFEKAYDTSIEEHINNMKNYSIQNDSDNDE